MFRATILGLALIFAAPQTYAMLGEVPQTVSAAKKPRKPRKPRKHKAKRKPKVVEDTQAMWV